MLFRIITGFGPNCGVDELNKKVQLRELWKLESGTRCREKPTDIK